MRTLRGLLPLLLIVAAIAVVWSLDLPRHVSWESLAAHRASLVALSEAHPIAVPACYLLIYAAATALSIPEGAALTIAGGFLFGTFLGAALTVVGATAGAILLFLAARTALARPFCARAGPFLERIRPGLERDGFSYLLALRLVPVLPFWLVNLAPALVGMRLAPFALATLIGIVPGTLVFASIGAGAGQLLGAGKQPDWWLVFSPSVLLPFVGLALLSLAPVAWRHWKAARG
ncbi:MAG: TVP38/TMEM64 family protein [Acetobacteraceae bacterium]|nr:TVP38/TMEM64 family protein [Acetobacteraceae bacterium]